MQTIRELHQIFRLSHDNFTSNIWGGRWLPRWKKCRNFRRRGPVGESWEFSSHKKHPSYIFFLSGKKLSLRGLNAATRRLLFGRVGEGEAPILVKFIDACDHLSLQVHPSVEYARRHETESGKSESWLILGARRGKNDGFIYLGFRPTIKKSLFMKKLQEANAFGPSLDPSVRRKAAALILPFLNKIRVKAGDSYHVPPGTPHIIGKGVRLFEIQLTSDLTYRVWDWNRPDPEQLKNGRKAFRPLHLAKALAVADFHPHPPAYFSSRAKSFRKDKLGVWRERVLLTEKAGRYALNEIWLHKKERFYLESLKKSFRVLTLLQGRVRLHEGTPEAKAGRPVVLLEAGQSAFIPATVKSFRIEALRTPSRVLKSYLP